MDELTKEQEARIYCIKKGHADYVTMFFGYVYCGRCGDQIGDRLAGIYDTRKKAIIGCKKKNCKECGAIIKKLSPLDKEIAKRLKKDEAKPIGESIGREKILEGLDFKC